MSSKIVWAHLFFLSPYRFFLYWVVMRANNSVIDSFSSLFS